MINTAYSAQQVQDAYGAARDRYALLGVSRAFRSILC